MTPFYSVLAGIFGLFFGSFLSMLIPRLHTGEKGIFFGRSHCPHCKTDLKAHDLIPLVSYLWLKGHCRQCKEKISFWYPVTELTTALTFGLLFFYVQSWTLFTWYALHFLVLLFIFFYDLRYKEIHDGVMLPSIVFAFIASVAIGNPLSSLLGAAVAVSFFGLQYLLSRGRWIGSGDLRIGAFMGLLLAWPMTLTALLASYIIGSLVSLLLLASKNATPKTAVPLGPFLLLGTMLTFFFGDFLVDFYLKLL